MLINRSLCIAFVLFGIFTVFCPEYATARQTIVIGSLQFGHEYWERTYEDDFFAVENEGDKRNYFANPEIELQSSGIHDTLSLRYAPVLTYDDLVNTTDVDHYLVLHGERFLTSQWNVSLTDNYVLSDNPTRYGTPFITPGQTVEATAVEPNIESPPEITQNLGQRRYWTNDLSVDSKFVYAENSELGVGYTYRVLRNESDDSLTGASYIEFDRHEFAGLWTYMFNPSWNSEVDLRYVKGLYDDNGSITTPGIIGTTTSQDQDLQEYRAVLGMNYNRNLQDIFSMQYRYNETQYEDLRSDIQVHELVAGWSHAFDSRNTISLNGGPSYVDADELDGEWGYNAQLNFSRKYLHGDISAIVDKRYEPRNFTGAEDTGLTDITDVRIDATYQFTQDLSSSIFGQYRYEDILDPQGSYYLSGLGGTNPQNEQSVGDVTYSRESYSIGAGVDYTFLRWFVVSVRYEYFEQNGDLLGDSYNDNRIIFQISANKELWRK